jgi:DNA-binding SARP family transcriptional activator
MDDSLSSPVLAARRSLEIESVDDFGRTPPRRIRLSLLPRFAIGIDDRPVTLGSRSERVLAYLAIQGGSSHRATVAGTLWPDTTGERALSSLRTVLWNLAQLGVPLVNVTPTTLTLRPEVTVDMREATDRARSLIDGSRDITDVPETIQLLRQEMLVDWAEDWMIVEQERFRQLRLHALEELGAQLIEMGRYAQAVVAALDAVGCDPLRETAHLLLMRVYLAQGNRCAAINQYRSCARVLHDELGLRPSRTMTALLQQAMGDSEVA